MPYWFYFLLYLDCPRGAGGLDDHKRKFLVHTLCDGQLHCMDAELYHMLHQRGLV